jgi:hypothetical protein
MSGIFVGRRAERAQARGHGPSWTADTGPKQEQRVVVAGPRAAAIGLRPEHHAHGVVAGLELATDVGEVDSLPIGQAWPRYALGPRAAESSGGA